MDVYCFRCKRKMSSVNARLRRLSNGTLQSLSECQICHGKKSTFVPGRRKTERKQRGAGIFSRIGRMEERIEDYYRRAEARLPPHLRSRRRKRGKG